MQIIVPMLVFGVNVTENAIKNKTFGSVDESAEKRRTGALIGCCNVLVAVLVAACSTPRKP